MGVTLIDQLLVSIILGLVQGASEWLPISSTAHLRVTEQAIGFQATPLFNVTLHLGTLIVVVFYFRQDIKILLTALVHRDFHSEYGRFIPLIVVGSIPTGIIGILYDKYLADNYQTFLVMGITFIIGATLLFLQVPLQTLAFLDYRLEQAGNLFIEAAFHVCLLLVELV